MIKGQIIGGSFGEILIRQKAGEQIEIGELLVSDEVGDVAEVGNGGNVVGDVEVEDRLLA